MLVEVRETPGVRAHVRAKDGLEAWLPLVVSVPARSRSSTKIGWSGCCEAKTSSTSWGAS